MEQTQKPKTFILGILSKTRYIIITAVVLFALIMFFMDSLIGNVDANEYQVKQAFMTGELSAHLTPGWFLKAMGTIYRFPKTETVYFTRDNIDNPINQGPVTVTFSDNSRCDISGTVRVIMPTSEQYAIDIVAKHSNRTFQDFAVKNIMPVTKRALITAATTMTAPDAKIKMADLATLGQDQLNNGIFVLESTKVKELDPATGEEVVREVKHIKQSADGTTARFKDDMPLTAFGANATNFVVTDITCSPEIERQISDQQQAKMGIATAKAKAAQADQEVITARKQGDANIAKIKAEEEAKAQQMIVAAERENKVQILNAQREVEISKLKKQEEENLLAAANVNKQRTILEADAQAYAKRKVMEADGALDKKLEAYKYAIEKQSEAIANINLPQIMINGDSSNNKNGSSSMAGMDLLLQMMMINTAKSLGLDMNIKNTGN